MSRPDIPTIPTAERPLLRDEERFERLERLATRLVSPDGFDRDALARIEPLPVTME